MKQMSNAMPKKSGKRILSFLLVLMMVIGLLPSGLLSPLPASAETQTQPPTTQYMTTYELYETDINMTSYVYDYISGGAISNEWGFTGNSTPVNEAVGGYLQVSDTDISISFNPSSNLVATSTSGYNFTSGGTVDTSGWTLTGTSYDSGFSISNLNKTTRPTNNVGSCDVQRISNGTTNTYGPPSVWFADLYFTNMQSTLPYASWSDSGSFTSSYDRVNTFSLDSTSYPPRQVTCTWDGSGPSGIINNGVGSSHTIISDHSTGYMVTLGSTTIGDTFNANVDYNKVYYLVEKTWEKTSPGSITVAPKLAADDLTVYLGQDYNTVKLSDILYASSGITDVGFTGYKNSVNVSGGNYNGAVAATSTTAPLDSSDRFNAIGTYTQVLTATDNTDNTQTSITRNIIVLSAAAGIKVANVAKTKPGNTFTYYVAVANSSATAISVDVEDIVHSGLTINSVSHSGTISGQTINWSGLAVPGTANPSNPGMILIEINVTVNADNNGVAWINGDMLPNSAEITDLSSPSTPVTAATPGPEIDLLLEEKTVTSTPGNADGIHYEIGDEIEYRIDFVNGDPNAQNVVITDVIPANTEYVGGSASVNGIANAAADSSAGAGNAGDTITWNINAVPSGTAGYVTFKVKVLESAFGTNVKNEAEINIGNGKIIIITNKTESPVVSKKSKVDAGLLFENGKITYTIAYEIPTDANTVVIRETAANIENATYIANSASVGGVSVTDAADSDAFEYSAGTATWTITGSTGDIGYVTFKAVADAGLVFGDDVKNKAIVDYYDSVGDPTLSSPIVSGNSNQTIDFIADANKIVDNASDVNIGDTLTYTIMYKNEELTAQSITITDIVPTFTTYVPGSGKINGADATGADTFGESGGTLTWVIANVPAGGSGQVTFSVTIDEAAYGVSITNIAEIVVGSNSPIITNEAITKSNAKYSKIENVKLFENGIIEYTIGYHLPAGSNRVLITDSATNMVNSTYIPGSAKINGTAVTDASDSDDFEVAGSVLTWDIAAAAGTNGYVTFKVQADDGLVAGDQVKNKGRIVYYDGLTQLDADDTNEVVDTVDQDNKTVENSPIGGVFKAGDIIDYKIVFENTNTTNAATITVTDVVPTGTVYVNGTAKVYDSSNAEIGTGTISGNVLTWVITNVAAQDNGYVTFSVKVSDDALGMTIENQGEYKFIGDNGSEIKIETNKKQDEIGAKMSKIENVKLFEGGIIEYTIGYVLPEEIGGTPVANGDDVTFTITDAIPMDTVLVPGTISPGGTESAGTITWVITETGINLASPPSGTVSFKVKVNDGVAAGTQIKNKAVITVKNDTTGLTEGPDDTNEVIDIVDQNIKTVENLPVGGFAVGDEIEYKIVFTNTNTTDPSTVTVTDIIPTGTTYVNGTAKAYDSTNTEIGTGTINSGMLTWVINNVAAQDGGYVIFRVRVSEDALGQVIENQGEYKFIGDDGSTITVVTNKKKDEIGAKMSKIANIKLFEGGIIKYTIGYALPEMIGGALVANGDNVTFTITDQIPANTTLMPGTISNGGTESGGTITWTFTETVNLANPPSGKVTFEVKVNDGVTAGTQIKNKAVITVVNNTQNKTEGPDDTNEVIDIVDQNIKTVENLPVGGFKVGDVIDYKIVFTNTNITDPSTVTVTDIIPDGTEYVLGSAKAYDSSNAEITTSAGVFASNSLTWSILNIAAQDSGYVTFSVKVLASALGTVVENQGEYKFIGDDGSTITVETNKKKDDIGAKMSKVENVKLFAGGIIEYTIGYSIPEKIGGAIVANGDTVTFTITDSIPTDTTLEAGSITGGGAESAGVITWTITATANTSQMVKGTVSFKVKVDDSVVAGDDIKNRAAITVTNVDQNKTDGPDPTNEVIDTVDDDNKETTVVGSVDIGDIIPYFIEFENELAGQASVLITDVIPEGTVYVNSSATVFKADGVTPWDSATDGAFAISYNAAQKTLTWTNSTGILPGTIGKVYFEVKVTTDALMKIVENEAEIKIGSGAEQITIISNKVTTEVEQIKESKITALDGVLQPNGTITYTVGYANNTALPQNITITDVIPTGTTYIHGSITGVGGDATAIVGGVGTLTWTIPNVAPGDGGLVSFRVRVDLAATPGTEIRNRAIVTVGNTPHQSNETVDIVLPKDSTVTHDPANTTGNLAKDDRIDYVIAYANSGTKNVDVFIVDQIPTGTELIAIPAGATGYDENDVATTVPADVKRLEWTITGLAPAQSGNVTFAVIVTATAGSIRNTGKLTIGNRAPQVTNTTVDSFPGGGIAPPPELEKKDHFAYIIGYGDDTVRPGKNITRAEVATIFFRLMTQNSRDAYMLKTNSYSDVSAGQWYNTAISTLTNAGIITGYPDGTFRPNASITRAELATMAARFDDLTTGTASFTDVTSDHWAYTYIISAATKGWVVGYQDGTFLPDKAITRAETVTLINRVLGRDKLDDNSFITGMITWSDNQPGAWYYEAIQEATNGHEYTVATNGNERWTKLNPPRDWAALEN